MLRSCLRFILGSLVGTLMSAAASYPALAAIDDDTVETIVAAVKAKAGDFTVFCQSGTDAVRKAVVGATMAVAQSRRMDDPMGNGLEAGVRIRKECKPDEAPVTGSASDLRWALAAVAPLRFGSEAMRLGLFSTLANNVFVPEGKGPFPAVVLVHTIGGIGVPHMREHARELLDAGFAVLAIDSYGPRNLKPSAQALMPAQAAKDAYDALAHLQTLAFIDRNRIYQAGYSWGAYAAALLANSQGATALQAAGRFRATVAHYGSCAHQDGPTSPRLELLSADSDRPVLMLMAENDIETPPRHCFPLLEQMKAAGKPVEWHVYAGATHGWDQRSNNVYRSSTGETMTYRHDAAVAADSTRRMIDFFQRQR